MKLTITIPLPPRLLQPNRMQGKHWAPIAQAKKKARTDAGLATIAAMREAGIVGKPKWEPVRVQAAFTLRTAQRRDDDSLLGWLKASFDGIVDSGLTGDDSEYLHDDPTVTLGTPELVVITVKEPTSTKGGD